jgi:hypothetical protein
MTEYIFGRQVVLAEVSWSNLSEGSKQAIQSTYESLEIQRHIMHDQTRVIEFLLQHIDSAIKSRASAKKILQDARDTIRVREA